MSKQSSRTIYWVLMILLGSFLNFGCAAKKMAVNNADTLIEYQVQKYLPLSIHQKDALAQDVDKLLNKHKSTGKELQNVLMNLDISSTDKLAPQYHQLMKIYEKIVSDFIQILSKQMSTLGPNQQKEFFATLEENNKKIEKRNQEDRIKKIKERLTKLFGSVNEKQNELLAKYGPEIEKRNEEWLERRKKLQGEFKKIFAQENSPEAREKLFLGAYQDYNEKRPHEKNIEILSALLPTLDPEQIDHFMQQIGEVKEMVSYYLEAEY